LGGLVIEAILEEDLRLGDDLLDGLIFLGGRDLGDKLDVLDLVELYGGDLGLAGVALEAIEVKLTDVELILSE